MMSNSKPYCTVFYSANWDFAQWWENSSSSRGCHSGGARWLSPLKHVADDVSDTVCPKCEMIPCDSFWCGHKRSLQQQRQQQGLGSAPPSSFPASTAADVTEPPAIIAALKKGDYTFGLWQYQLAEALEAVGAREPDTTIHRIVGHLPCPTKPRL